MLYIGWLVMVQLIVDRELPPSQYGESLLVAPLPQVGSDPTVGKKKMIRVETRRVMRVLGGSN